jgi:hypothetical protein
VLLLPSRLHAAAPLLQSGADLVCVLPLVSALAPWAESLLRSPLPRLPPLVILLLHLAVLRGQAAMSCPAHADLLCRQISADDLPALRSLQARRFPARPDATRDPTRRVRAI